MIVHESCDWLYFSGKETRSVGKGRVQEGQARSGCVFVLFVCWGTATISQLEEHKVEELSNFKLEKEASPTNRDIDRGATICAWA